MHTENQNTQKDKFTNLLEWLEDVKFSGTKELQHCLKDLLTGWLSSDFADAKLTRSAYMFNTDLISKGIAITSTFSKQDFDTLQRLIKSSDVS